MFLITLVARLLNHALKAPVCVSVKTTMLFWAFGLWLTVAK